MHIIKYGNRGLHIKLTENFRVTELDFRVTELDLRVIELDFGRSTYSKKSTGYSVQFDNKQK